MTELVGSVHLFDENQAQSNKENVGEVSLFFETQGDVYLQAPFVTETSTGPATGYGGGWKHQRIEISADDMTNKFFILNGIPTRPEVLLFLPEGGIPQFYGSEFTVNDNIVSWDGLGLDGFIEENEIIHVYYT
jgi:hypothetical protein